MKKNLGKRPHRDFILLDYYGKKLLLHAFCGRNFKKKGDKLSDKRKQNVGKNYARPYGF